MKQHHLAANHGKYYTKNPSFKMAANFPQVLFHFALEKAKLLSVEIQIVN